MLSYGVYAIRESFVSKDSSEKDYKPTFAPALVFIKFKAFSWLKLISLAGYEVVLDNAYLIQGVGIHLAGMESPTVKDGNILHDLLAIPCDYRNNECRQNQFIGGACSSAKWSFYIRACDVSCYVQLLYYCAPHTKE